MKQVLVIDNYDSFTYNLVHMLRELQVGVEVRRNDQLELEDAEPYDYILLSPGPGLPKDAGLMPAIIDRYVKDKQILGVCLGHQGLAEHFGGVLTNLPQVYHGVVTPIKHQDSTGLFEGIPRSLDVCRYHSWVVEPQSFPKALQVTSLDEFGRIMSFQHESLPVYGVQFHPESVMTQHGMQMIKNWLKL